MNNANVDELITTVEEWLRCDTLRDFEEKAPTVRTMAVNLLEGGGPIDGRGTIPFETTEPSERKVLSELQSFCDTISEFSDVVVIKEEIEKIRAQLITVKVGVAHYR